MPIVNQGLCIQMLTFIGLNIFAKMMMMMMMMRHYNLKERGMKNISSSQIQTLYL